MLANLEFEYCWDRRDVTQSVPWTTPWRHISIAKNVGDCGNSYCDCCDIIYYGLIRVPTPTTSPVGDLRSLLRKIDLTLSSWPWPYPWLLHRFSKKLEVTSGCLKTKMNSYPAKLWNVIIIIIIINITILSWLLPVIRRSDIIACKLGITVTRNWLQNHSVNTKSN